MNISVIVATLNSERTLEACLKSVLEQETHRAQLIVVDNFSTDHTFEIAKRYADIAVQHGPERSAQRNYGARIASGQFLLFVDSDMILTPKVLESCAAQWKVGGCIVAVPEISFGTGFWAQCKSLERSCYAADRVISGARFFEKDIFEAAGCFDSTMYAGEDWDLSIRAQRLAEMKFSDAVLYHDEGALTLGGLVRKKFYYGRGLLPFLRKHKSDARARLNPLRGSLFGNLPKIMRQPHLALGVAIMKGCEMLAGVAGLGLALLSDSYRRTK